MLSSSESRRRSSRARSSRSRLPNKLARQLAEGPTIALGAIRQSVAYAAGSSFEEALAFESAMMAKTRATSDHEAAVAAFVGKWKPDFIGR